MKFHGSVFPVVTQRAVVLSAANDAPVGNVSRPAVELRNPEVVIGLLSDYELSVDVCGLKNSAVVAEVHRLMWRPSKPVASTMMYWSASHFNLREVAALYHSCW